jgi:hypothetical protein
MLGRKIGGSGPEGLAAWDNFKAAILSWIEPSCGSSVMASVSRELAQVEERT